MNLDRPRYVIAFYVVFFLVATLNTVILWLLGVPDVFAVGAGLLVTSVFTRLAMWAVLRVLQSCAARR